MCLDDFTAGKNAVNWQQYGGVVGNRLLTQEALSLLPKIRPAIHCAPPVESASITLLSGSTLVASVHPPFTKVLHISTRAKRKSQCTALLECKWSPFDDNPSMVSAFLSVLRRHTQRLENHRD
jgi:hypothetical protein